jgi:hypothetical protein
MTTPTNEQRQARIARLFQRVERLSLRIDRSFLEMARNLTYFTEQIMADKTELNAVIADLKEKVRMDEEQDDANEVALKAIITDLEAKVAAGLDVQPQIDALNEVVALLHAPAGPTPSPTPPV